MFVLTFRVDDVRAFFLKLNICSSGVSTILNCANVDVPINKLHLD